MKSKIFKCIKQLIYDTALCYTAVSLAFAAVGFETKNSVFLVGQLVFLLFSFLIAVDFALWRPLKIHVSIKRILHFIFAYLAFFLCFFVLRSLQTNGKNLLLMSLLFLLIYVVIGGVKVAFIAFANRKKEDIDYKSQFHDLKKK